MTQPDHDGPYSHADFAYLALAEFPELQEEFEDYADLLHLQMAAFARRLQQAKGEGDWESYGRGIAVAARLWSRPDADLLNALNVSFLEHLDFEGPRGPTAWEHLTPELQAGWRAMQAYLARLAALPHRQAKTRPRRRGSDRR